MKYFRSISLLSVAALAGCGEPSHEQCIRDAVKDGKSEYGITVLTDLCDAAKSKRLEARDKKCFAELTKKFGETAVQNYKDVVVGQYGRCDPDIKPWVLYGKVAGSLPAEAAGAVAGEADATNAAVEAGAADAAAKKYADWMAANASKRGTAEFNTVARAYQEAKAISGMDEASIAVEGAEVAQ